MDATQPRMLLIEQTAANADPEHHNPARAFLIRFEGRLWHVHVTEWIPSGLSRSLDPATDLALLEHGRIGCSARRCHGDGFAVSPWLALAAESLEAHTLFMAQCDGRTGEREGRRKGARCDNMFRVVMRQIQDNRDGV